MSAGRRYLSNTSARSAQTAAGRESGVLIDEVGTIGKLITLNRPRQLNALSHDMVTEMTPFYDRWSKGATDAVIVMKGSGEKAFCAGGDIVQIRESKLQNKSVDEITEFFRTEYVLNQMIGNLPSRAAQVSLYNGIVMGGGVGLSVHAKYRVACETTLFAMPETHIGLFPDVGGSHFLPRLKYNLGMYLALTGTRLKGADVVHAGVATHYVPQASFPLLEKDLLHAHSASQVPDILKKYSVHPRDLPNNIHAYIPLIDRIFSLNSAEEILAALKSDTTDWAAKHAAMMEKCSPTSLKITLNQLREGAKLSFSDCFRMEYQMTREIARQNDFFEGVRAMMVDKDNTPKWSPATLAEVDDSIVSLFFPSLSR